MTSVRIVSDTRKLEVKPVLREAAMGDIGPVRRHIEVLPLTKPVLPAPSEPAPKVPARPVAPGEPSEPAKVPASKVRT